MTYAAKLAKEEGRLDFRAPVRTIVDRVRAFDPWPGCVATLVDDASPSTSLAFKVWKAEAETGPTAAGAGRVLGRNAAGALLVAAADGVVALTELQKPGGRRQPAASFAADFGRDGRLAVREAGNRRRLKVGRDPAAGARPRMEPKPGVGNLLKQSRSAR